MRCNLRRPDHLTGGRSDSRRTAAARRPGGSHASDLLFPQGLVSDEEDRATAIFVGTDWADGDRQGAVDVTVEDSATAGPCTSCQDESLPSGPDVTCETLNRPDGSTVYVGHGERDGVQRVSVGYDRPDGTVVIATADEATERW